MKTKSIQVIRKDIVGFPNYSVDTLGRVFTKTRLVNTKGGKTRRHTPKNEQLKQWINGYGYPEVVITKENNTRKTFRVYKLVALTFIPNRENKPCINHKNGNKLDSSVSNLEWVTYSENERHSYDVLGKKASKPWLNKFGINSPRCKPIKATYLNGSFNYFGSGLEASRILKIGNGTIYHSIRNNIPTKNDNILFTRITLKQFKTKLNEKNTKCLGSRPIIR